MKDKSGPAFPIVHTSDEPNSDGDIRRVSRTVAKGMTLRQWYAGMAMQGMLCNPEWDQATYRQVAEQAFRQADAMLAQEADDAV